MKCSLDISNFLEEISSVSRSIVFLFFFALFIEESLIVLWNSAFSWGYLSLPRRRPLPLAFHFSSSSAICKASSDNHFAALHLFFFDMFDHCFYTVLQTSVHSSSGTLSDLIPWIQSSPALYNHKGFDIGHTWMDWTSLIAQLVKNPPAMQETLVQFLGQEDPLEKEKATHSSILAWRIPRTV